MKRIDKTARKRRFEAGTTIVEATIVLPLMLMLTFGIAEFGISFTRWNSLTNAVREGARAGVVFRVPCASGAVTSLIETTVSDFADSSGIDPTNITTTVTGACGGTGTQLIVTSTVPYDYIALDALAGFAPSTNLSARTVMRNE
ncbi:MAG: pilus assembly protein [Deltaproteobacteria bacterium]|nr:pilus assembly protein [Deltaproteobacteria bacterium]